MIKTNCFICKKILYKKPHEITRNKSGKNCCITCFPKFAQKMGFGKSNKGRKATNETIQKLKEKRKFRVGELSPNYKGDNAGYFAIHNWIRKKLGSPKKCEHCKTENPKTRYEWANISRKNKREPSDWIRLCKKCHSKFDEVGKGYKHDKLGKFIKLKRVKKIYV